jgi:hypothetical protein
MSSSRAAVVAAVLVGLLAAGCGAGDELRGAMSATAPPPPEAPPTTEAAPADPGGPAGPCTGERLAVSLGPTTDAGGIVAQDLILQNTGTASCVMRGFPSVVAVAGNDGAAVGEPALPVGERGAQVRLEPRAAATVPLRVRDTAGYDERDCRPKAVRGLRLLPPGGSGAVFVPREGTACSDGSPDPPQATVGTAVAR